MSKKWVSSDFTFAYRLSSFLQTTICFGLVSQAQVDASWKYLVTEARDMSKGPISGTTQPQVKTTNVPDSPEPKHPRPNNPKVNKFNTPSIPKPSTTKPDVVISILLVAVALGNYFRSTIQGLVEMKSVALFVAPRSI